MKFFLDHDVPDVAGRVLIAAGHEVTFLRDHVPQDTSDADVFDVATQRNEVLVTCSRDDFLRLAEDREHAGVNVLIRTRSRAIENAKLLALIDTAGETGITGNINFA